MPTPLAGAATRAADPRTLGAELVIIAAISTHGGGSAPWGSESHCGLERYRCNVNRREISRAYKERKRCGGVYTITNTQNGRYLIGYSADVASVRNRFQFALTTGSAVDPRLRQDWEAFGPSAFTLDVLEELEQKPDQNQAEFLDELKTLEQMCRANLDASKAY